MFLRANGADVYYERHGGAGPHVLLLHGWGCSTALWKPIAERLSTGARVTALDFPGHGQSSRPPEPWGAPEYARMTAEVIEALGMEGCHVIGHSHGGRIALLLAAQRPDLVGKLVLTGAAGLRGKPTQAQERRRAAYKRLRGLADVLEKTRLLGQLPEKLRAALRKRYGSADYNALDSEMRKTFVKVVNFDLTDSLPEIKAPTLLLWGSEDMETPLWMARRMEEMIPDAGLVLLQGGGHFAYLEKAGEFLVIAEHFLLGGSS